MSLKSIRFIDVLKKVLLAFYVFFRAYTNIIGCKFENKSDYFGLKTGPFKREDCTSASPRMSRLRLPSQPAAKGEYESQVS
jgi:hypothetical protein